MHDDEIKQLLITIIETAKTTKLSEFRFIRNWSDYRFCKGKRRSYKLLIQSLQRVSGRLFKKYCSGVVNGTNNINQLLAYQQLQETMQYYTSEYNTYTDMVFEYEAYLMEGNYLGALLGDIRPYDDLRDFRD